LVHIAVLFKKCNHICIYCLNCRYVRENKKIKKAAPLLCAGTRQRGRKSSAVCMHMAKGTHGTHLYTWECPRWTKWSLCHPQTHGKSDTWQRWGPPWEYVSQTVTHSRHVAHGIPSAMYEGTHGRRSAMYEGTHGRCWAPLLGRVRRRFSFFVPSGPGDTWQTICHVPWGWTHSRVPLPSLSLP
jgi:hypothetical protein